MIRNVIEKVTPVTPTINILSVLWYKIIINMWIQVFESIIIKRKVP